MAWANESDVENITGKTISADTIALASAIVDTFADSDEERPEASISNVDRRHLKRATAWQAVWIAGKPGLISERENAQSITSDTQAITRRDNADGLLAPLARREIVALSWKGTRTSFTGPVPRYPSNNFINESSDPPWFGGGYP